MSAATVRPKFEALLAQALPFDDEILAYLLRVAPNAQQPEMEELVNDFCPMWSPDLQTRLARLFLDSDQDTAGRAEQPLLERPGYGAYDVSQYLAEDDDFYAADDSMPAEPAAVDTSADEMLARMLQEKENSEEAFCAGKQRGGKKKGRGGYKPIPINYTVGRNQAMGTSALGTTGPSNLAELLRSRRQAEQRPANAMQSANFGPPASRDGSAWAPPPQGGTSMTWAERAQFASEKAQIVESAPPSGTTRSTPPSGNAVRLTIMLNDGGRQFHIDADPGDCFADVKVRIEKQQNIPAGRQRLLYRGRELTDGADIRSSGVQAGMPIQLAVREASRQQAPSGPPSSTHSRPSGLPQLQSMPMPIESAELYLRIKLPGGVMDNIRVPATATCQVLKQRIQQQHGIRSDHLSLSFFGYHLIDSQPLRDCGIANNATIDAELRPPGVPTPSTPSTGYPPMPQNKKRSGREGGADKFAGLQSTSHGRILNEEEALEVALAASQNDTNGRRDCGIDIIDNDGSDIDSDCGDEQIVQVAQSGVEFHVEVSIQNDSLANVIAHAKRVASSNQVTDFISRVSKRSGIRLTLLTKKPNKSKNMLAYAVYRFKRETLHVLQVGVAAESRGQGYGRQIVKWLVQHAKKMNVQTIFLSSLPDSCRFFEHLGFKQVAAKGSAGEDYADGHTCLEYTCKRRTSKGKAAAKALPSRPSGLANLISMTRAELAARVFTLCDKDGNGYLDGKEMNMFATETGFDGTDEDWLREFQTLCHEHHVNPTPGVDARLLAKLIDDESDNGCYCTDQELREMVSKFEASLGNQDTNSSASAGSSRRDLIRSVFHLLGADSAGFLHEKEMRTFATQTGFEGSDADWHTEYNMLFEDNGADPQRGIDVEKFESLVEDQSESGCYCTDDELRAMIRFLEKDAKPSRSDLIQTLFRLCDLDNDGYLVGREMQAFASKTGFSGSDEDWQSEYQLLCRDQGADPLQGLNATQFNNLVDDQSDNGCYCNDDELRVMIHDFEDAAKSKAAVVLNNERQQAEPPVECTFTAQDLTNVTARNDLIQATFQECDYDGDGFLLAHEMLEFAKSTGFGGSDEEWRQEYETLCADHGADKLQGLDLNIFTILVNDQTENGCYCSDQELKTMIAGLKSKPRETPKLDSGETISGNNMPPSTPTPLICPEPSAAPSVAPSARSRTELIESVFASCDVDGDAHLSEQEMHAFARHTGFDGSAEEWHCEYDTLCGEVGAHVPSGLDLLQFTLLVNDSSDRGCYCSDEELRAMLRILGETSQNKGAAGGDTSSQGRGGVGGDTASQGKASNSDNHSNVASSRVSSKQQGSELAHAARADALPPVPETAAAAAVATTAATSDAPLRRNLIKAAFEASDFDSDGFLCISEMRGFAEQTGFSGSDKDWQEEYRALCSSISNSNPLRGIDYEQFTQLVNDTSDEGCYCSDKELQDMTPKLAAMKNEQSRAQVPSNGVANNVSPERQELISTVFRLCDLDCDDHLLGPEMFPFACQTGFSGTSEEWEEEYRLLCADQQTDVLRGIDAAKFTSLVNDTSDNGCFCTDEELKSLIHKLEARAKPGDGFDKKGDDANARKDAFAYVETNSFLATDDAPPPPPELYEPPGLSRDVVPLQTNGVSASVHQDRAGLVRSAFEACDADKDGCLSCWEMHTLAAQTGFDGSQQEWLSEYELLCSEHQRSTAQGVDFNLFARLVDDTSDNGCYCTDDDLRQLILEQSGDRSGVCAQAFLGRGNVPVMDRTRLVTTLFRSCDADHDGFLSMWELHNFSKHIGFDGSNQDWVQEYKTLCEEHRVNADQGIDPQLFARLVDDQSDSGCYCSDDELIAMIKSVFNEVKDRVMPLSRQEERSVAATEESVGEMSI